MPPDPVTDMAEHEAADRAHDEADGERGERSTVPTVEFGDGKNVRLNTMVAAVA